MRKVLNKHCQYCKKQFYTYDSEMVYCNAECRAKEKYADHFRLEKPKEANIPCQQCGVLVKQPGKKFCNSACMKLFHTVKMRVKYNNQQQAAKPNKKGMSLEYLNRIEEHKEKEERKRRVFSDSYADAYIRGRVK